MRLKYKKLRLERLRDPKCAQCVPCKSTRHRCILGKGNAGAKIFLVGEAPGQTANSRTTRCFEKSKDTI